MKITKVQYTTRKGEVGIVDIGQIEWDSNLKFNEKLDYYSISSPLKLDFRTQDGEVIVTPVYFRNTNINTTNNKAIKNLKDVRGI